MDKKRPVNLDLLHIKQPVAAIVSILHRISGITLFLAMPVLLWLLAKSLHSQGDFNSVKQIIALPTGKIFIFLVVVTLLYHWVAGIRHFLMDMHIGESLAGGQLGARIVLLSTIVLAFLSGVWLW